MHCPVCASNEVARYDGYSASPEWRCRRCSAIFADLEPEPVSYDDDVEPEGEFRREEFEAAMAALPARVRDGLKIGFREAQETMDQLAADLDAAHARIVELQKDRDGLLEKNQVAEAEIARLVVRLSEMAAYQAIEEQPK